MLKVLVPISFYCYCQCSIVLYNFKGILKYWCLSVIVIIMLESTKIGEYIISQQNLIGSGSHSRVYLGQSRKGKKVAIKKVKKINRDPTSYYLAKSQAKILKTLNSPLVSELLATYEEQNYFYIVQRYYQGKTLAHLLKQRGKFSYNETIGIFSSILKSLQFLVSKGIMHRDLKPENLIYYHQRIIIIDFGFACKYQANDAKVFSEIVGTPIYMSPELLSRKKYNSKSDIWSLGVILFEMIYGYPPYQGKSQAQILTNILKNRFPAKNLILPSNLRQILSNCLNTEAEQRANWKQLFSWRKIMKIKQKQCIVFEGGSTQTSCCCFN